MLTELHTEEPITIKVELKNCALSIQIDGVHYATIDGVKSLDEVDLVSIREWIESIYCDADQESIFYVAPTINKEELN